MSRLTICFLLLIILLLPGLAAAQSSDNLCYTAFNRACYDDIEWEIGYFWAHNAPSKASCAKYHWTFGDRIGDIWGMCNEYGMPDLIRQPDIRQPARQPSKWRQWRQWRQRDRRLRR